MKIQNLVVLFSGALALKLAPPLVAQTIPGPQPTICTRPCWGARAPNGTCGSITGLSRVIIHHTATASHWNTTSQATSASNVRGLQNHDMDVQGFCDIEYHWMIDKFGNIFEARHGGMSGLFRAYHDACNNNSHGISFMAYFHPPYNHVPSQTMLDQLYALVAWRMPAGWTPYGSSTYCSKTVGNVDGHRKVVATACPGDGFHPNLITENYNGGPVRTGIAQRRMGGAVSRWYYDNGTDGWTPGNSSSGMGWTASGWPGIIYTDQIGNDAYWYSPGIGFAAAAEHSINVDVFPQSGTSANHDMQIFWKTSQDNTWTAGKSTPIVTYTRQNAWARINLDVGAWSGTINQLRLDFDDISSSTRWIVNHVYTQKTPKFWFGSSASGWASAAGLSGVTWTASGWPGIIYADQTGNDAHFVGPGNQDYLGGINDVVRVRVFPQNGATANHDMQVFWATESSGFSEANSVAINYTAKDAWADLTIPVGHKPEWNGHFIRQLRLDVDGINQGNRWIIDYIAISHLTVPATPPVAPPDIIIDNPSATVVGTWTTGTTAPDKFNADYRYRGVGGGTSYLQFTPTISIPGNYQIYEWHPAGSNRPSDAKHVITHNGGSTTLNVNQQVGGGAWNLLGTFNFSAGTTGNVRITDGHATSGLVVMADAIKFVYVP